MSVRFAKTHVDRAIEAIDLPTLYNVVRLTSRERELAEPLQLFLQFWEWVGATRSGIWQYYEGVPIADFNSTAAMMDRSDLPEIAARYRAGMECWDEPRYCDDLDHWIAANEKVLEETALQLIRPYREQLYSEPV